jgi:hypothetical protein
MLSLLDFILSVTHLALVGFNLFGWIWRRTRKAHLITVALTAASWFLLGIWYGVGYCPITDWQWSIKERLGQRSLPDSFIKYFADLLCNCAIDAKFIEMVTAISFIAVAVLSIALNLYDRAQKKPGIKRALP